MLYADLLYKRMNYRAPLGVVGRGREKAESSGLRTVGGEGTVPGGGDWRGAGTVAGEATSCGFAPPCGLWATAASPAFLGVGFE